LDPTGEIEVLCSRKPLDAHVLGEAGLPFHPLDAAPFPYRLGLRMVGAGVNLLRATLQARSVLRWLRSQVVVGVGGYVSVPVLVAARLLRIPAVVLVQDVLPDRANRFVARWAHSLALVFPQAQDHFPGAATTVTGAPIRQGITATRREEAAQALGLNPSRLTLLVMGGSQGARRLNQGLVEALPVLLEELKLQVIHLTGEREFASVQAAAGPLAERLGGYWVFPFRSDMGTVLAGADLVLARSGANSLAEFAIRGLPMLLVPYPHAAGHQRLNAEVLAAVGAATCIQDASCTGERILEEVRTLLEHPGRREQMSRAAAAWARPEAARTIAEMVLAAGERSLP
jgi:UDP-N-acetylglucosamine--N-acetylmuramyl-(pentapeptide) pyrophosphoryl-undecaprenol N-acetylglucosamine transferase